MEADPVVGVTGAGGYIGSCVATGFLREGFDVVAVDDFSGAQVGSLGATEIVEVDVRDAAALEEAFSAVDAVCHLAALSGVPDCEENPQRAFEVNVQGTANVGWLCRTREVPLVFASSMAAIGEPREFPIGAEHPRSPTSLYGLTKKMSEDDIADLAVGTFPAYVYQASNLYGTHRVDGTTLTKETVINVFVEQALADDPLTVHEPGTQTFDFVHVEDVARAFQLAVRSLVDGRETGATTVPLASGEQLDIRAIADIVRRTCAEVRGYEPAVAIVDNPRESQPTGRDFTVDTERAHETVGFEAEHGVEETVRRMLANEA